MPRSCRHCLKSLPDDNRFCPFCGAETDESIIVIAPEGSLQTDGRGAPADGIVLDVPPGAVVTISPSPSDPV